MSLIAKGGTLGTPFPIYFLVSSVEISPAGTFEVITSYHLTYTQPEPAQNNPQAIHTNPPLPPLNPPRQNPHHIRRQINPTPNAHLPHLLPRQRRQRRDRKNKATLHHAPPQRLHTPHTRARAPPRRQHIIKQQDTTLANAIKRIRLQLKHVRAVFLLVRGGDHGAGQLPRLAHGDQRQLERGRDEGREDEGTRFERADGAELGEGRERADVGGEGADQGVREGGLAEDGEDVDEGLVLDGGDRAG